MPLAAEKMANLKKNDVLLVQLALLKELLTVQTFEPVLCMTVHVLNPSQCTS
jgi:hypothetical protein